MRVGVTGSSGFLGAALVRVLEGRGDQVVRFVRPGSTAPHGDVVRWDPSAGDIDEGDLRRVGGFDAVVHFAGAGIADRRWSARRKAEILSSRTKSTTLLVDALKSTGTDTKLLASGSAIGYYGSRGDELLDETSSRGDDFLADVCAKWEDAALELGGQGTAVALLRTGIVMSAKGGALKKQLPLFRVGLGGQLGSGRQWLSPISLEDYLGSVLWIIGQATGGPFNLTAPQSLTNRDFTTALAHALHRPSIASVPAWALRIALGSELCDVAVLASQRVEPRALLESGFQFRHENVNEILVSALTT